jgi:CheY-like chemotaxis protein
MAVVWHRGVIFLFFFVYVPSICHIALLCFIIREKEVVQMATVLIADDNPQLLNILKNAAQKEGYDTILAEDGQAALDAFYSQHPHMILLDVMMPKLDGFQVCREIRRESDVPIIMITARGEDFEKIMGLEIGNSTHQRGDAPH